MYILYTKRFPCEHSVHFDWSLCKLCLLEGVPVYNMYPRRCPCVHSVQPENQECWSAVAGGDERHGNYC